MVPPAIECPNWIEVSISCLIATVAVHALCLKTSSISIAGTTSGKVAFLYQATMDYLIQAGF